MKLGIMQPYFVPYIGYWQLLNAVDKYVIYDDVNFIKGGWVNRNRILSNNGIQYFNIQMIGASPFKLISQVKVDPSPIWRRKALTTLQVIYKKAPYFDSTYSLLKTIIGSQEEHLSKFVANSIRMICDHLSIDTTLLISSEIEQDRSLQAQDRVLDICKHLDATEYYNAVGGMELYSRSSFAEHGIKLFFVKTHEMQYRQFKNEYIQDLSIIDVMMFNSTEQIREMLEEFDLV